MSFKAEWVCLVCEVWHRYVSIQLIAIPGELTRAQVSALQTHYPICDLAVLVDFGVENEVESALQDLLNIWWHKFAFT